MYDVTTYSGVCLEGLCVHGQDMSLALSAQGGGAESQEFLVCP